MATAVKNSKTRKPKLKTTEEHGDMRIEMVKIAEIVERGNNHRIPSKIDKKEITRLAGSIEKQGQLQPIRVYLDAGKLHRVFGYRRCEAMLSIGEKLIQAQVLDYVPSDAEVQAMRAEENLKRKQLNPAEEALAVQENFDAAFAEHQSRDAAITATCDALGEDKKWVEDCLNVTERLSKKVRDRLAANEITFAHAKVLIRASHPKQEELADMIVDRARVEPGVQGLARLTTVSELLGVLETDARVLHLAAFPLDVALERPAARRQSTPVKRLACVDCEQNSCGPKRTLYEVEKSADPTQGKCNDEECFDFSTKHGSKANNVVVAEISKQVKAGEVEKSAAASKKVVETVTLETEQQWVRPEAVQRAVKKELKIAKPAAQKKAGVVPAQPKAPTENDRRIEAKGLWLRAFVNWREEVGQAIRNEMGKDPMLRLIAVLLRYSRPLVDLPEFNVNTVKPEADQEQPITPLAAAVLDQARTCTMAALSEIAETLDLSVPPYQLFQVWNLAGYGTELVERIAKTFGVKIDKPAPQLSDYLGSKNPACVGLEPGDFVSNGVAGIAALRVKAIRRHLGGQMMPSPVYVVEDTTGRSWDQPDGSIHKLAGDAEREAVEAFTAASAAKKKK